MYNHLAIVDRARAGNSARINLDSGDSIQILTNKEGSIMDKLVTINLDGLQYQGAPEVQKELSKLTKRIDEAEEEKKDAENELEQLKADMEKLKAERDEYKSQLDEMKKEDEEGKEEKEKKGDQALQKAVKERLSILKVAEAVLDSAEVAELDDKSNKEIKSAVIEKKHPSVKLDSVSDIYIDGRFDAIAENVTSFDDDASARNRKTTHAKQDGTSDRFDEDKASKDAFESLQGQYKKA